MMPLCSPRLLLPPLAAPLAPPAAASTHAVAEVVGETWVYNESAAGATKGSVLRLDPRRLHWEFEVLRGTLEVACQY